ncbi:hypothetical protein F383_35523 [Gossypium arboreum]|uniref:Uncharacterized protein n=1 Tax=Gossypium arboreum TaxID=29729 RepID=A0A0B0PXI7_GOSAR|nr:hypothetical protein F383_35523 [Gossypium arboreum]
MHLAPRYMFNRAIST